MIVLVVMIIIIELGVADSFTIIRERALVQQMIALVICPSTHLVRDVEHVRVVKRVQIHVRLLTDSLIVQVLCGLLVGILQLHHVYLLLLLRRCLTATDAA